MAGIIERNATAPLVLKQRTGIADGKPVFASSVPCYGMVFDFRRNDRNEFGNVQDGKIFLVSPLDTPPAIPGLVSHGDKDYEIKSIKTIRNMKGIVIGYRIAAAGGA